MRVLKVILAVIVAWLVGSIVIGLILDVGGTLLFGWDANTSSVFKFLLSISTVAFMVYVGRLVWRRTTPDGAA
ncbi:hypothetical protein LO762_31780 [Actinocorallia sp. API 0066]|uniref:hypothetical protein n=1 Tax=Actinocorallia sp. API 0066 TaxID=2896846 RepID=UPI001E544224|nr:hypothetical protein [Actinocorallia sp. API 0066]MCD0453733.1 hypothetical protein [Actinocorallia sp. API 0066]